MRILDLGAQRAGEQRNKTLAAKTLLSEEAKEHSRPVRSSRPRVWPYPGGRKVLDRPFRETSGRRHVPKLINANKVPILQFKKPQSPFLSRMIRDIIKTRQKRVDLQHNLKEQVQWARGEDAWDFALRKSTGLDQDQSEERWSYQPQLSHDQVHARHSAAANKQVKIAAKMHVIVEKEKALAFEEKWERHRMKMERRLDISRLEQPHSEESVAKYEPRLGEEGIAELEAEEIARITGEEPDRLNGTERESAINEASRPEPILRRTSTRPTRGGRTKQQLQMENKVAEQESPLTKMIIAKMRLKENLGRTGGQVNTITWTDEEKAEIKAARRQRKEEKAARSAVKMERMEEQDTNRQRNGKRMTSSRPNRRQRKGRRHSVFAFQPSQKRVLSGS